MVSRELSAANDIDAKDEHPEKATDSKGSGRSSGIGIGSTRGGVEAEVEVE